METDSLDNLLKYYSEKPDYRNWQNYKSWRKSIGENFDNAREDCVVIASNTLYEYGLLHVDFPQRNLVERKYIITIKGRDLVATGKTVQTVIDDIKAKEILEKRILEGTANSFFLNRIQFAVTFILAIATVITLFFQYCSYKISNDMYEIEKKRFEIELLSEGKIDTASKKAQEDKSQPYRNSDTTKSVVPEM